MHDVLEAQVEYCWIDMQFDSRETDASALEARIARLESLVARLAAAGPESCRSSADGLQFATQPDDEAFVLELNDDDDCD